MKICKHYQKMRKIYTKKEIIEIIEYFVKINNNKDKIDKIVFENLDNDIKLIINTLLVINGDK